MTLAKATMMETFLTSSKSLVDKNEKPDIEELQEADVWACLDSPPKAKTLPGYSPIGQATRDGDGAVTLKKSASVDVPGRWNKSPTKISIDVAGYGDDEILPPHVLLKRRAAATRFPASFSVREGAGRTLKGRDAIAFRNAVLRKTGFIEN